MIKKAPSVTGNNFGGLINKTMQDNEKSWKERFDRMKDYYGYGLEDIAEITGNSHGSIRTVINSKSQEFPRWLKLAIVNFELEREREIEKDPDFNPSVFE